MSGDVTATEPSAEPSTEDFGKRSKTRLYAVYGLSFVVAAVLLRLVLGVGNGLTAPEPAGGEGAADHGAVDTHEIIWKLLLASAVIIIAARLLGAVFRRFGQPQVVGEIVAGIVLGPSLLGVLWPAATSFLFPDTVLPFIEILAQVGLIFFMFLIGLELDMRLIRGRGQAAVVVSHASITIPFLLGVILALALFSTLGSAEGDFVPFALFLGASMSVTAFPVLARILTERGLYKTRLGAVTITCAAVDDVTAWCLLAVVVAVAAANGLGGAFLTIALAAVFIAFMLLVVRPLLQRVATWHEEQGHLSASLLALIFVGILLSALATDRIGIHAIFGAFLFGAIMPQRSQLIEEMATKLEDFTVIFLLPLFFAYSGLRTEIGELGADPALWGFCALIVLVAIAGKWGGSTVAARFVGLEWREAMGLGILMNCRGLTELVILNIGLDLGVIPPALFAMLVIMALVTTFMTTPLLNVVYSRETQQRMVDEAGDEEAEGGERTPWRILVPIADSRRAYELAHTALSLARDQDESVQVILLRAVRLPESSISGGVRSQQTRMERETQLLRPLVEFIEGAGYDAVPLVVPTSDLADTIIRVADERDADLVLLNYRRPLFGSALTGTMGEVLRGTSTDVAVLVDPTKRGLTLDKGNRILVPYGGGFHEDAALAVALRLARSSGGTVTLIGDSHAERAHQLAERAAASYEDSGVWTTPVPVNGDYVDELVQHARTGSLVVLGVSDEWADDPGSLGSIRHAIAALTSTPMLIVRRHGQPRRRGPAKLLQRLTGEEREWMTESTGEQAVIDLRAEPSGATGGDGDGHGPAGGSQPDPDPVASHLT